MTIDPLIIDLYPRDAPVDYDAFCAAGHPWSGVVFKASQGTRYRYDEWIKAQRNAFIAAVARHPRAYGELMFDGFYHYLDLSVPGTAQADLFCRVVDGAGGEKIGTLWGMVDVERGGQAIKDPSRALVEDCTRGFADRYHQLTGRTATLYGGELLRSVGVTDRLGCGRSAIALYNSTLPADIVRRTGTDLDHLMLWQYQGTEAPSGPAGYPRAVPGSSALVDVSAIVLPGGLSALRSQLWAEHPIG